MIPFSILDLAPIARGGTPLDAFRNSVELAHEAERLDFHRIWLAEHHGMAGIASAATVDYVRMVSGSSAELLTSGFEMMNQRQPVGQVGTPLMRSARMNGLVGEVELIWSSVPGAHAIKGSDGDGPRRVRYSAGHHQGALQYQRPHILQGLLVRRAGPRRRWSWRHERLHHRPCDIDPCRHGSTL